MKEKIALIAGITDQDRSYLNQKELDNKY